MLLLASAFASAQNPDSSSSGNNFRFSGNVSGWGSFTPDLGYKGWLGGRYIPQLNYSIGFSRNRMLDFEGSANIYGDMGLFPLKFDAAGKIKPYRLWARFSSAQYEVRAGLQKINFGSAQLFRPLMWFDSLDPRDPLQLTDGVWGGLFRYYFQNNANIWLWGLAGNKNPKGWEPVATAGKLRPEVGGRLQIPLTFGEGALSFHFRQAGFDEYDEKGKTPEIRIGLDIRADAVIGLWFESSYTRLKDVGKYLGIYGENLENQLMATLGADYTFGIGNGLAVTAEHMMADYSKKAFSFEQASHMSGVMLSYPVSVFDNISAIVYYDWRNRNPYNFVSWQKQFNKITFYLMAFWNPPPEYSPDPFHADRFAGKGLRLMVVWDY